MRNGLENWKFALQALINRVDRYRIEHGRRRLFFGLVALNFVCYWVGMWIAFPELLRNETVYYSLYSIPLAFIGAGFDVISLAVSLALIRRALGSSTETGFLGHIGADVVLGCLSVLWIPLTLIPSGWIAGHMMSAGSDLAFRMDVYFQISLSTIFYPLDNWPNTVLGVLMGISALIPTIIHLAWGIRALSLAAYGRKLCL